MPPSDLQRLDAAGRIGVYGLGREGQAIARFVRARRPGVEIDVLLDSPTHDAAAAADLHVVAGTEAVTALLSRGAVDIVVRSPGVPLRGEGLTAARQSGIPITSGTNLWFEATRPDNVVAITGTKGKSTTAALLAHLLESSGLRVALLGNIGTALLDAPTAAADHDVVVVELSSYQLADLHEPVPVGVWLNLHHEHLDWHGSHAAYAAAKRQIVTWSRTLVAAAADPAVAAATADHADVRWVDTTTDPVGVGHTRIARDRLVEALDRSSLYGSHHIGNLAAALTAGAVIGVPPDGLLDHVATFTPLPHRLQLVHDDGRRWIDDSISTIPETAVAALRAFPDAPVTLLAGGFDRGQDHAPLVAEVAGRTDVLVITMPVTGRRLAKQLRTAGVSVAAAEDLDGAVTEASRRTPDGGVVLLSPAAPSYGSFASFEQRGEAFTAMARRR